MTTPPGNWQNDFTTLTNDVAAHKKAETQLETDRKKYLSEVLPRLDKIKDPMIFWMVFFYYVATSTDSSATLTGMNDDKTGVLGTQLKTASALTQLTNDLQNMTTDKTSTTTDLKDYASHLDQLLDLFNGTSQPDKDFQDCFSGSTGDMLNALKQNFTDLRHLVNAHDGSGYDPDSTDTYYFDTNPPSGNPNGYFNSFSAMITAMGEKNNPNATSADKALTDSFSSASSNSGGINAAINEEVSLNTNYQKSFQAFLAQLMKDIKDTSQAVVTNQKTG